MPKILLFAGSARKESMNKKLVAHAAGLIKGMDAEATEIDLKDYAMPIYDGDDEKNTGLPENAKKLKQVFVEHDGFFISSPEYNSSFSPLLKNTLDWISRPHEENEASLIAFKGKVAALGAVSPGGLGGMRGLVPLRMMLGNIGVFVIPTQTAIGSGFEAFDDKGALKDERQANMLKATLGELVASAAKLS
jgi:NAD(P)H-dependent FMN reductase